MLPAAAPSAAVDGPGRPHTDLLERLLTRGRELAGTLIRSEVDILERGIVAGTEAHRRHILTTVPNWHIVQLALSALAVYTLRPSNYTPEVNILWASKGACAYGPKMVCSPPATGSPGGPSKEFSRRPLHGVPKAKMMALEGLFRKLEAAMVRDRDSILRRMEALRVPRGVEDDPAMDAQWFEHFRASATAMDPIGAEDGRAHGSP